MHALEELQTEKGDYLEWPQSEQQAFLTEYGTYYDVSNYIYPGPDGLQVWEALKIASEGINEKYGVSMEELQKMRIEVSYLDYGTGIRGGDRCTLFFSEANTGGAFYQVDVDTRTGAITDIMN